MLPRLAAQHVVPACIDCRGAAAAAAAAAEELQQRLRLPKLLWLGLGALVVIAHNVDSHEPV
jgi:alpha-D-ribose 1-methylphosphonate 5-triphosphate synthase subunit PhnL